MAGQTPPPRFDHRRALQAALRAADAALAGAPDDTAAGFERAALLAALGFGDAAKAAYLEVLTRDPTHLGALTNLGGLALASGHRSAALSAYRQAAECHPANAPARVNLANVLLEDGEPGEAEAHYRAALALDPACAEAHQGLSMLLVASGDLAAAEPHRRRGFQGRSLVAKPYRGEGEPIRVLLLVSARGGNVPTSLILDDRVFQTTALYAEFHDPAMPLPAHDVVFNAVGDAELCAEALAGAVAVLARASARVVNAPEAVAATDRQTNARRFGDIPGLVAPRIERMIKAELGGRRDFPLLLRAPGYHAGQHFVRVDSACAAAAAIAGLPGDEVLAIEPLATAGADGLSRKYRVMMIDGGLYPLHLAAAADWKVHYFSSAMAERPDLRIEEAAFLVDMQRALGPQAMAALAAIRDRLGLDYAGVDFGLDAQGRLLFFEANATMAVTPPDPGAMWDYRRAPIARALAAAKEMIAARAVKSSRLLDAS